MKFARNIMPLETTPSPTYTHTHTHSYFSIS